ncbi:glycoside hydrolase family 5 protein [Actinomadura madurae]|uniref:glycoside hydrolase family 5 protein n=1 Tax=Actinomadura madurae TaxID=1993 RepID=UPI002026A977|nr:cellulase family glycosylhydrolase [Actinomadura madurae]URM93315.1 glycoside hydrolase family 5 protein [Actinomadura madurae]URN04049.1 glycoside hydrolase family 5 protein [Actinomadura madurae]
MTLRRRASALATSAALAASLAAVPTVGSTAWAGPAWEPSPLRVAHGDIVDSQDRTVLLRGTNVNQLVDYAVNDPALPTVVPLTRDDFAQMATLGFTVVRLNVSWSALEPRPGAFATGYVAKIRKAVRDAADHGMYTVLDMHQDAWGRAVGTPPDATCPPFMQRARGWDGAPAWATLTGGVTTCTLGGIREVSPAVALAFQNFYDDKDGVQSHLVRTWARLASALAREPGVAGYDLLNEPNPGLRPPGAAAAQLGRFYGRAIAAIRAAEDAAGAPRRLMIVEPSALWSAFGIDALPPREALRDDRLVFSPHLYNESITLENSGALISIERGFALARAAADHYGAALWSGEWGWFGDPGTDGPKVVRYAAAEDAHRAGGAWWVWRQACGDPHSIGDGGTTTAGGLNRLRCPDGTPLGRPAAFTGPLSRPFPRAAPGRLTALSSSSSPRRLSLTGTTGPSGNCRLDVWIPGDTRPDLTTSGMTSMRTVKVPGGWRITACATDTYHLQAH